MRSWPLILATLLQLTCGGEACGGDELVRRFPGIAAPDSIDLGLAWVGHEATAALLLLNTGAAEGCAEVEAELDVRPRSVCLQPGESVEVEVLWLPRQAGPIASRLQIHRTGDDPLDVEVLGLARKPPECMPADVCHVASFDSDAGTCVGTELADGSACDAGLCMRGGSCLAGTCSGQFACDDGDPCTTDVCGANGCTTLGPASACPEAPSTCLVRICSEGECGYAPAPDGIECAPSDCTQRFFCSAGACLPLEAETEGATCVGQCGEGICLGGSCSEGFPATAELLFHYEPNADSTFRSRSGNGPSLVLDSEGRAFWLEEENKQQFVLVGATTDGVFIRRAIDGDPRSGWPPQLLVTSGVVVVS